MADPSNVLSYVREACEVRGLSARDARLLHHYNNAVVLIPHEQAVARVAVGRHDPNQIRRSQVTTRWLSQNFDFPATVPLPGVDLVELASGVTVSFWIYYSQPLTVASPTSVELGRLIYKLHQIDQPPPLWLPTWQPLISLDHALSDAGAAMVLTPEERHWLKAKIREVRQEFTHADSWLLGQGLIHGDAWAGNLLQTAEGFRLGDWDHISYGPREVDLIPTWHASRRYGKGRSWASNFATIYGFDLSEHPMVEMLFTMRDLVQVSGPLRRAPHSAVHAAALHDRLTDIREKHMERKWTAL
jgi:hypothetical protein